MGLRFESSGVGTAYISVPIGGAFRDEEDLVRGELTKFRERNPGLMGKTDRLLYLLGQADMALQVHLVDFQKVSSLAYPGSNAQASTVNWVFSVPYRGSAGNVLAPRHTFRFILHLRFARDIFAYRGAEEAIIDKLFAIAGRPSLVTSVEVFFGTVTRNNSAKLARHLNSPERGASRE